MKEISQSNGKIMRPSNSKNLLLTLYKRCREQKCSDLSLHSTLHAHYL